MGNALAFGILKGLLTSRKILLQYQNTECAATFQDFTAETLLLAKHHGLLLGFAFFVVLCANADVECRTFVDFGVNFLFGFAIGKQLLNLLDHRALFRDVLGDNDTFASGEFALIVVVVLLEANGVFDGFAPHFVFCEGEEPAAL